MPASMDYPSPKRLRSESEAESADKDRISCLPEDVIGFILSLLTSREAQATCLLSRRWRHLCTCRVTNLDFDWYDLLAGMKDNPELLEKERARYVEWVDNVLHRQSGGYYLQRFALRFDLNISHQSHIDQWIRFALAKRVKVLHLCFEAASFKDLWPNPDGDPSRLPHILGKETLMDAEVGCSQQEHLCIRELPKLTSVKQLELRLVGYGDESLLPLTLLIEACPYLSSLVFELTDPLKMLCRQRELVRVVRPPHRYLKAIEFYNYRGQPCDHELVNYLIENAIALEKLEVNTCDEEYFFSNGMESVKEPRERALQQLKGNLPSGIELVIS